MNSLNTYLSNYLSKKTSYAIQLTGNWGSGKTYYFRKTLMPIIEKTDVYSNASKKYKVIYVSLFGQKSVESIMTKIASEFYLSKFFGSYIKKGWKRKTIKVSGSIIKMVLPGFLNYNQLENIKLTSFSEEIKSIGNEFLDTNELFICFDDLERKDSLLSFADLLGYINTLVDQNIKVLIICNDDIIKKEEQYNTHIEKIIGIKFPFRPDVSLIIDSIINQEYSGYPKFTNQLKDHNDLLVSFTKYNNNNFRSIEYAISILHNCYGKIEESAENLQNDTRDVYTNQISNILRFILLISLEYKQNKISYQNLNDFRVISLRLGEIFHEGESDQNSTAERNSEILKTVLKKYHLQTGEYRFFQSIFTYITGGIEFTSESFFTEFKAIFHLTDDKLPLHYKILKQLDYRSSLNLSDDQYVEATNKMLAFAKSGLYDLPDYLTVIFYIERHNNPLNLNLENEIDELQIGFSKAADRIKTTNDWDNAVFGFSNSYSESNMSELNIRFHKYGMKVINAIKEEKSNIKLSETANLFKSNFSEFIIKYQTDSDFRYYVDTTEILKELADHELINLILRISLSEIESFNLFIKQRRYEYGEHPSELSILKNTIIILENNIKAQENNTSIPRKLEIYKRVLDNLKKATKS